MFGWLFYITHTSEKMLAQKLLVCIMQQIFLSGKCPKSWAICTEAFREEMARKSTTISQIGPFFSTDGLNSIWSYRPVLTLGTCGFPVGVHSATGRPLLRSNNVGTIIISIPKILVLVKTVLNSRLLSQHLLNIATTVRRNHWCYG